MNKKVWVLVDQAGIIMGASVGSWKAARKFFGDTPVGYRYIEVDTTVRIGAHISAPDVYPPLSPSAAHAE